MYRLALSSLKVFDLTFEQCDPEAAQTIFSSVELAAKTTLIPLDLTHQVLANKRIQARLLRGETRHKLRILFHEILMFFARTYSEVFGLTEGPPLHDPIAVAVLLDDLWNSRIFDYRNGERWHVQIVTDGQHSDKDNERGQLGRTVVTKAKEGGVRIPREINVDYFWDIVTTSMDNAQRAVTPP